MVWVALLYSLVGSVLTHLVGRPLIPLNFQQQRYEADFRLGLVRVRENAEGIALYYSLLKKRPPKTKPSAPASSASAPTGGSSCASPSA